MARTLELRGNTQAMARMLLMSAVVGGALLAAFAGALSARFELGWFHPEHGGPGEGPWVVFGFLGGLFSAGLCWVLVLARQPRGAKLTWDDWGVTEWDGEGARTAISRAAMKARFIVTSMGRRAGGGGAFQSAVAGGVLAQGDLPSSGAGPSIGGHLILTDDAGRRIDVTQGTQALLLNDRLSTVDAVMPLVEATADLPRNHASQSPASETLAVFGLLLGIAGYLFALFGMMGLAAKRTEPWPPIACMLGGVLLMLRALPWLYRARKLNRPRQERVEIVGGDERQVKLSSARVVELGKHPDAGLSMRRGEAWLGADGVLETGGARQARLARRRANLIMGLLRVAGGVLVAAFGVEGVAATVLERSAGMDPRAHEVWRAKSGSAVGRAIDVQGQRALVVEEDVPTVLDLKTGEVVTKLVSGQKYCSLAHLALSPGSRYALVSCDEDVAHLWSLEGTPRELKAIKTELSVNAVALGEDVAVVSDGYGACHVFSLPDGAPVRDCAERVDRAEELRYSPATGAVAFISLDASAYHVYLGAGAPAQKLSAAEGRGEALAFSPDGALLAVADSSQVTLLDGRTGEQVGAVPVQLANGLAFSNDGTRLAVAAGDSIHLVDVASRNVIASVPYRWKKGPFSFESDSAGALAIDGEEVVFLARWRGMLLRVRPR